MVKAGKIGVVWWVVVVSEFGIRASEYGISEELEGRCRDGAFC